MLVRSFTVIVVACLALTASDRTFADSPLIRQVGVDHALKTSEAVVVDGSLALVHTTQILPIDDQGAVLHPGRLMEQTEAVLDRLESTLKAAHSGLDQLIKVNVYLARAEDLAPFQEAFASRLGDKGHPAISQVVGRLAKPKALVALDAVAAAPALLEGRAVQGDSSKGFAVLPVGPRVYISGQAEPDENLARATAKTLKGLDATLRFLALDKARVVQLKAFVQPITSLAEAEREIVSFFGEGAVPPLVFVEWTSGKTVPIE
ncbi:MAG: RidA family protein, partial [Isosphaeraceae bacterium]